MWAQQAAVPEDRICAPAAAARRPRSLALDLARGAGGLADEAEDEGEELVLAGHHRLAALAGGVEAGEQEVDDDVAADRVAAGELGEEQAQGLHAGRGLASGGDGDGAAQALLRIGVVTGQLEADRLELVDRDEAQRRRGELRGGVSGAREQTLSSGFGVPNQLDDMLVHLGPAPAARPPCFLQLATDFKGARDNVEAPLMAARALAWPPLFDVEPTLKKVNDAHPNMSAETPESDRYDALMSAVAGDTVVREALQGIVANLLEDAASGLWLNGHDEPAAQVLALAGELRSSESAETLPWVGRLLGFQIATTLAYIQRQQQQQQQRQVG